MQVNNAGGKGKFTGTVFVEPEDEGHHGHSLLPKPRNLPVGCSSTSHLVSHNFVVGRSVVRLDITGMMCTKSCTPTVQKALEEVDGVESANVSLENKCAWVKVECLLPSSSDRDPELIVRPPGGWQGTASPDVLIAAVNAAGGKGKFEATLHVEDE